MDAHQESSPGARTASSASPRQRRSRSASEYSTTTNAAPATQPPWGHQRSDETPLAGDALARVKAIAEAKVAGGTVIRVETDADGVAAYEAHMTRADGSPVTVYVDKDFDFVSAR